LVASWLRDYVFVRSFEQWKERRALLAAYHRYRDPLLVASEELRRRIAEICEDYPPAWLQSAVLDHNPRALDANLATDRYYQRYRFTSTVFRLCAWLGWLELYRQDVTFLDAGQAEANKRLRDCLDEIRDDLSEGGLNTGSLEALRSDRLIFKEEQRAIGESMLIGGAPRTVMGYAAFARLFNDADVADELWWIRVVKGFLADPESPQDFRRTRLQRVGDHLDQAIRLLRNS
jgi:hypothetical protein